jgi:hypothetical protein
MISFLESKKIPEYPDAEDEAWWREAVGDTLRGFTLRQTATIDLGGQWITINSLARNELLRIRKLALRGARR